ncbi:MAG: phage baseplate protein [Flavobacteriales bacterium]|nr:phage baseplate protein [Flavobacteriales bacterium]
MSDCNEITSVLKRGGTDQGDRNLPSLNPDSIKLQGFGIEEWMQFAYNFADDVKFFNTNNIQDGDWKAFFKNDTELKELLETYQLSNKLTPHLTLFICFLRLLEISSNHFNSLSKKHLDFYYSEVLQISKLPEQGDKVHILFELAKNIANAQMPVGTELDGERDAVGKKRTYELIDEIVVNKAKVAQFKNIYNDPKNQIAWTYPIKGAPVANSYNGAGEKFPGDDTSWRPFGYNHIETGAPSLPDAKLGFAVASSTLALSEGTRNIVVEARFNFGMLPILTQQALINNVQVFYTGEKGWVGPVQLSSVSTTIRESASISNTFNTGFVAQDNTGNVQRLTLVTTLQPEMEAVTSYNKAIHGEQFKTTEPVFRFLVKTDNLDGFNVYKRISSALLLLKIKVGVLGMKKMVLQGDTGPINITKPFYPFTTIPVKGSSFSVYNEEIFSKKWNFINVNLKWKDTPASFNGLYRAYDQNFLDTVAGDWFEKISAQPSIPLTNPGPIGFLNYAAFQIQLQFPFQLGQFTPSTPQPPQPAPLSQRGYYLKYNSIVTNNNYFKASVEVRNNDQWMPAQPSSSNTITLFKQVAGQTGFYTDFNTSNISNGKTGPLRLSLNQSFLHELYPKIYALALSCTSKEVLIPNQPYTPFVEELTVEYSAEALVTVLNPNPEQYFNQRSIQLFHEHPYGQVEEHQYLKLSAPVQVSNTISLAPYYGSGGELYIGLEDVENLQQISLLIQILEGTENPLTDSFTSIDRIDWDILCSNFWKPIVSPLMLVNQVDNFLKTGIVKFVVPKEATSDNTLLPSGLFWVRARMNKKYDAVCRVLSIDAQAVTAEFDNKGNDLSHLEKGISANTISKLVDRSSLIKKVVQPYNSFGGKPIESDFEYYRRVSERLRHKNRAITLWDYEKLTLQQFPELYKVKCLNHTCECSFVSGGNVTLVVIPDTKRKNVFDNFQPRVSKALLNQIENYLSQLNSLHVKTHVINPEYEEVQVKLKVKFYEGLDIPFHIEKLNSDIIRYLSPWAYETKEEIQFGVTLYRTMVIDYLEKLDYVDYLQDVKLVKNGDETLRQCSPSSPKGILVSAKKHDISTEIIVCTSTFNLSTETC